VTHTVQHIFERACAVLGVKAEVVVDPARLRPDKSEVLVLLSDPSRAKKALGWEPTISLDQGLELTAKWLKDNLSLYNLEHFHR
jgi:UDP-glucose 4-epimerase